jgi:hypothetical protein
MSCPIALEVGTSRMITVISRKTRFAIATLQFNIEGYPGQPFVVA